MEDTVVYVDGSASSDNVGVVSYVWTFTDGEIHTLYGVNPGYIFETPDVYWINLTVSDAEGYSSSDGIMYNVQDNTAPTIEVKKVITGIENNPTNFDASQSSDNTGIANYSWSFDDGTVENTSVSSVIHIFNDPRIYAVELIITDIAGNANRTNITVDIKKDTDKDLLADQIDEDDDGDGIPNVWELENKLDPLDPSDANIDSDGDGINNLEEYQGNTDPRTYDFTIYTLFIVLVGAVISILIAYVIFTFRHSRKLTE